MSAPTKASAEASPPTSTGSGAGPAAPDRAQLREEYATLGKKMRRWLLGGAGLLLAVPLLWWLPPAGRQLVPTPTGGYRWRQAGTVQDSGTTWVWALADSAGQARLLLSRTGGRTWLTRNLGVPAAQARALALGWGSPWRGVLLGEKGELRVLPNARREPRRGEALTSRATRGTALGVDASGRQVVLADSLGLWKSLDGGQSWLRWNTPWPITQVLFEPAERRFFAIAQQGIGRQTKANSTAWEVVAATSEAPAPVLYATFEGGRLFIIYQNGRAVLVNDESQPGGTQVIGNYQVFSGLQQPLALVGWPGAHPEADTTAVVATDSALVFVEAAAGGLIQRLRLETRTSPPSQSPVQQSLPTSTSQSTRTTDNAARAALVARAEAAAKDTAFRSRNQNRPAKSTTNPPATARRSPGPQTPTRSKARPDTTTKPPLAKTDLLSNGAAPGRNPTASPNQSPVQQSPTDQRPVGKGKE